jgi:hypothetical protein
MVGWRSGDKEMVAGMNGNIESIDHLIAEIEKQDVGPRGDLATDAVAAIKRVWAIAYLKGLRHGIVHGLGGIADAERIAMTQLNHMASDLESSSAQVTDAPSSQSPSQRVAKIDMQPRTQWGKHDALVLEIVHANAGSGITYHYICKAADNLGSKLSDSTVRKILPRLEGKGMVTQRSGLWYPAADTNENLKPEAETALP